MFQYVGVEILYGKRARQKSTRTTQNIFSLKKYLAENFYFS